MLCEVHDQDGLLADVWGVEAAKRTAVEYWTLKRDRRMHIEIWPVSSLVQRTAVPMTAIRYDAATGTWGKPEPLPLRD